MDYSVGWLSKVHRTRARIVQMHDLIDQILYPPDRSLLSNQVRVLDAKFQDRLESAGDTEGVMESIDSLYRLVKELAEFAAGVKERNCMNVYAAASSGLAQTDSANAADVLVL